MTTSGSKLNKLMNITNIDTPKSKRVLMAGNIRRINGSFTVCVDIDDPKDDGERKCYLVDELQDKLLFANFNEEPESSVFVTTKWLRDIVDNITSETTEIIVTKEGIPIIKGKIGDLKVKAIVAPRVEQE